MKRLLFVLCVFFSSVVSLAGTEIPKDSKGNPCRCGDGDGACELMPLLDTKSKTFDKIVVSKTKDTAYTLKESTRILNEHADLTLEQGGCAHAFYRYTFTTKNEYPITDTTSHLKRLAALLAATQTSEGADIAETVKKSIPKLHTVKPTSPKSKKDEPSITYISDMPYSCDTTESKNGVFSCTFEAMPNFSYLSIRVQKAKDNTIIEVTEDMAL